MTLYDRYINGQTKQVFQEIYDLGPDAFLSENLPDVEKVLIEAFKRTSYNLNVIYTELKNINYLFKKKFDYNFQRPLIKPLSDTKELLLKLEEIVRPFGYVPLSLKMFYKIVGACNLGWDYDTNENYIWRYADPIQIISLDDLVREVTEENNLSDMTDYYEEDGFVSLQLAADYFHKDNTSGGPVYSLQITKDPSVDGLFLNEEHNTTFVNYLRVCFENCGFPRIKNPEYNNNYQAFFDKVQPQLKPL